MTQFLHSADGTRIGFDDLGTADAPAVIYVHGATAYRGISAGPTALAATGGLRIITYDRRGRGDSGDTPPYAVEREIDDIAALVDHAGAGAILLGESSGAVLALEAALAGVPVVAVSDASPAVGEVEPDLEAAAQRVAALVDDRPAEAPDQSVLDHDVDVGGRRLLDVVRGG